MKPKKKQASRGKQALLTFLKRTRAGKYARIDENSLPYARLKTLKDETQVEEEAYYYSTR